MSKIFVIMGKSASGKDTIFKNLERDNTLDLKTVVIYTTRTMREGEANGVEYFFTNKQKLEELKINHKIIEHRSYNTVHGTWDYFTVNDGQINLNKKNYIVIGTIESFIQMKSYYGEDVVIPIYLEVDDGIRLERALQRERRQKEPKYAEMCRRFLADEKDFSKENMVRAGINKKYSTIDVNSCKANIIKDIREII